MDIERTELKASVKVDGLRKSFDSVSAIRNVTVEFAAGKRTVLLGPSGCGKTTLLRCIAGLERPDAGTVDIGVRTMVSIEERVFVPPHQRRIGMVFQSYALWPHMSVFDNVGYPLKVTGVDKSSTAKRIHDALALVQLQGMGARFPAQLSGGQQQRIAFARAVVGRPDVLLLDEPLSNLDAKLREEMRFEIVALQQELGITMIHVTHDQSEAMALADHLVVMRDGVVVQAGEPEKVYLYPTDPFVADFMDTGTLLDAKVVAVDGERIQVRTERGLKIQASQSRASLAGVSEGTQAVVCLRQDAIELNEGSRSTDGANSWNGVVVASSFVGDSRAYRIAVEGELIQAKLHRLAGSFPSDAEVSMRIDPSDVHVYAS